jgi:hypothetical protein
MRLNLEQNKECLIGLSRFKFSLVINGLTEILKTIDTTVGLDCHTRSRLHTELRLSFSLSLSLSSPAEVQQLRTGEEHSRVVFDRARRRRTMSRQRTCFVRWRRRVARARVV